MIAKAQIVVAARPEGAASCVVCAGCGMTREQPATRRGDARVPAGWKRLLDRFWCPACKRQRFVRRAVALPVSGPADATWPELRAALHTTFGETTRCANWLVTQFYARDRQREPHDARLPAMPRVYLYPEARRLFPSLASQTLASLEQQVLARYRAARLALVWRHAVSLPTYRYPTPLPLPARMWTLECRDQRWHLSVRIGDRRWSLRLRQGPGMRRQLDVLRQIAAGHVEAGEATLYEIHAHSGDHRSASASDRRLMVKIAVWLAHPARERDHFERDGVEHHDSEGSNRDMTAMMSGGAGRAIRITSSNVPRVLIVQTAADAFLSAHVQGAANDACWRLHGDQVRRWIAQGTRRRERLHQDLARMEPDRRGRCSDGLADAQRLQAARLQRRLHDWTHQATAQLVAWARQHGVSTIVWDDTDHGYLPAFPWHRFQTTLIDKAAMAGIGVTLARPEAASDDGDRDDRDGDDRDGDDDGNGDGIYDVPTNGHLQAEARARPGTLAGRDRSWERAQAPEIAGHAQAPPERSR
jgi:hypothetical protein